MFSTEQTGGYRPRLSLKLAVPRMGQRSHMIRMDSPTHPRLTLRSPEPYLLEGRMRIIVQLSEDERGYNGYELRRALDALCVAIHPNEGAAPSSPLRERGKE